MSKIHLKHYSKTNHFLKKEKEKKLGKRKMNNSSLQKFQLINVEEMREM